jgi:nicotinate-nucleotide pyrophosphorylase (carboxylating)
LPAAARTGAPEPLARSIVDPLLEAALKEDVGTGDLTSDSLLPPDRRALARLVAKKAGVLAGIEIFARVFELCDPESKVRFGARDGEAIQPGQELARIEGRARALLRGERTALNLLQRMCGIATLTARYVERCLGARVLDTRKTTPLLRAFEKYAVRCGGGENHRFGLFDEVMVKNNHVDLAGGGDLTQTLRALRAAVGPSVRVTAEARTAEEALAGVRGDADVVMLDNMNVEAMRALCPRLREAARARNRPLEIEASGGINLDTIGAVARCGVDRVSVGALTHSAPALDLSLYLQPLA